MNYFRQIYYEMKHQRMMTWVSVSGTALSIFLVMAFIITDNFSSVEMAPESRRSRILTGWGFHERNMEGQGESSTGGISVGTAERLYEGLDGVEKISYVGCDPFEEQLSVAGGEPIMATGREVDASFWEIYDFKFIDGHPFDDVQVAANEPVAVVTRSTARRLFGEENVAGREIEIRMIPFRIAGVVEDPNPLLGSTFANFYQIFGKEKIRPYEEDNFGSASVLLLLKEGVEAAHVKRQVEERYRRIDAELKKENCRAVYHAQPYTAEEVALGDYGSNTTPELAFHKRTQWVIYAVLLLLPAINLSSMTRGRLRHRVAEIGVRRAFGARKLDIVAQLFMENLIITLIGGFIGVALSIVFLHLASEMFFQFGDMFETSLEILNARPDLTMLFQWSNFALALLFCLILNVMSATVPAWKASRRQPAAALSASR